MGIVNLDFAHGDAGRMGAQPGLGLEAEPGVGEGALEVEEAEEDVGGLGRHLADRHQSGRHHRKAQEVAHAFHLHETPN